MNSSDNQSQKPLTRHDYVLWLAKSKKQSQETRDRVFKELEDPNSPASRWLREMDAKLKDPFDIDPMLLAFDDAKEPEGEVEE